MRGQITGTAGAIVLWLPGNERGVYINGAQLLDGHQRQQINQFASTLRALQTAG